MDRSLRLRLLAGSVAAVAFAGVAAVPEYYQVLSAKPPSLESRTPVWEAPALPAEPTEAERVAGFRWGVEGIGVNPRPDFDWRDGSGERRIRVFLAPGEFRNVWLPVRSLRALSGLTATVAAPLVNEAADQVATENFLFQRTVYALERKQWNELNCFFVGDMPWRLEASETWWILATLHAPAGTPGGLYRGEFTLASADGAQQIPVEMAVLDHPVPFPEIPLGAFVPGHYFRESVGKFVNYAPEWQTPELLGQWVKLWHSRGLNSPFLYHLYVEAEITDGEIHVAMPFLDDLIRRMHEVGMAGPLLLDMRHLSWWSYQVALQLAEKGMSLDNATLEVKGEDGVFIANTGAVDYPELAKEVFRRAMEAFDAKYRDCGIPILYLSEEEIGYHQINGFFNPKTVGYEAFNPVLIEVVGRDRVCLVDNSQGYGYPGVDRGARDDIRFRSYNNWTLEALEACERDGAEPWLYNGGWSRAVAGYMMRLKAKAFHQWADGWVDPAYGSWLVTAVNDDGALSSLQLERTLEGIRDLGYFQLLDVYREKALAAGLNSEAETLAQLRRQWFDALPVNAPEYMKAFASIPDRLLDQRRWECVWAVSAVQTALGEKPLWHSEDGHGAKPAAVVAVARPERAETLAGAMELVAVEGTTPVTVDGKGAEELWKLAPFTSSFRWTALKESQMRALASSQEEFERMESPSGSSVQVGYDDQALYFYGGGNHTSPAASRIGDDDPEIWSDDVFEFFWQEAPNRPEWHLIVNSRGNRTLFRNGQVVKDVAIVCAVNTPLNATGGVGFEVSIPWRVMEREGKPDAGTVWQFNICRNFSSWGQLSSWAQVENQFGLGEGRLVFGGASAVGEVTASVQPAALGIGANALQVRWEGVRQFSVVVADQAGREYFRATPKAATETMVTVDIPADAPRGRWWVRLYEAGRECAAIPLWFGVDSAIRLQEVPETVVAGMPLVFQIYSGFGNAELAAGEIPVTLIPADGTGKVQTAIPLSFGRNRAEITTDALTPGKWRLQIGETGADFLLLPGPYGVR